MTLIEVLTIINTACLVTLAFKPRFPHWFSKLEIQFYKWGVLVIWWDTPRSLQPESNRGIHIMHLKFSDPKVNI